MDLAKIRKIYDDTLGLLVVAAAAALITHIYSININSIE
jgi:hypothetical protein